MRATTKTLLAAVILSTIATAACGETIEVEPTRAEPTPAAGGKGDIWGEDDRSETYQAADTPQWARLARASAMLTDRGNFVENVDESGEVVGYRLAETIGSLGDEWGMCETERFVDQPRVGFCSATLVAPDLVATSGHCIASEGATPDQARCDDMRIVFDFGYRSADDEPFAVFDNMSVDSVYECERVEAIGWIRSPENEDWALVRLDRPVTGREPIPVLTTEPRIGTPILQIGHPTGIPQKLAPGEVTRERFPYQDGFAGNTFTYKADLFGGNSGGGVFDLENNALAGIPTLYSGQNYVWDQGQACYVPGVCGENTECLYPPGGYGTFKMLEILRESGSPLIDELTLVEGEVDAPNPGDDANLFISEYVEGSGWNKAIEVFNPSRDDVDVSNCSVSVYSDGSIEASATQSLTGILPAGSTFTFCDSRSDIDESLCAARAGLTFNGNDAVVLRCGGIELDVFGTVGVDPGESWAGIGVDQTLRRTCDVWHGADEFDDATWEVAGTDDFSGLGQHVVCN
jgi:hypothetical protein